MGKTANDVLKLIKSKKIEFVDLGSVIFWANGNIQVFLHLK